MTPRLSRATSASSLRTPRVHAARVREVQGNVGPLTSQGKPVFENQVSRDRVPNPTLFLAM